MNLPNSERRSSMPQHRTRHSAEFKAKVALAALSESNTLAQLASYQLHATQMKTTIFILKTAVGGVLKKRLARNSS